eukprot:TRINITY_DN1181_c0_g1_i1.p1 TRINITY_DN1181_c0_g1~~TRINITY_DN1181_c0_g1_i1.p1  ORF type:complete len:507 (-),score=144.74 TRINITY_DN1181_c0_g1_i1:731-2251(-)
MTEESSTENSSVVSITGVIDKPSQKHESAENQVEVADIKKSQNEVSQVRVGENDVMKQETNGFHKNETEINIRPTPSPSEVNQVVDGQPSTVTTATRRSQRARKPKKLGDDEEILPIIPQRKASTATKEKKEKKNDNKSNDMEVEEAASETKEDKEKDSDDSEKDEEEKESDDEGSSEEGEEDPNLYCICQQRDDGRPMIQCDGCNEWYHAKCLKLTKKQLDSFKNKKFICHVCLKEAEGKDQGADKSQAIKKVSVNGNRKEGATKSDKQIERAKTKKSNRKTPTSRRQTSTDAEYEVEEDNKDMKVEGGSKQSKTKSKDVFDYSSSASSSSSSSEDSSEDEDRAQKKARTVGSVFFPEAYKKKESKTLLTSSGGIPKVVPTSMTAAPKPQPVAIDKASIKARRDLKASRENEENNKRRKLASPTLPTLVTTSDKVIRDKIVSSLVNALKMPSSVTGDLQLLYPSYFLFFHFHSFWFFWFLSFRATPKEFPNTDINFELRLSITSC